MEKRLLVTSAGSTGSNNLTWSLRAGDPSFVVIGCNSDRFVLKQSSADRNYLVAPADHLDFANLVYRTVEAEHIDLLIPTLDSDVKAMSRLRGEIPCRLFLPDESVIDLCQDKYELTAFLRTRGLPAPLTYTVTDLDGIEGLFRRLAPRKRLWCRMRRGTGSMAAIPVKSPEQARSWISYWHVMRGVPPTSFTLSEYLPGRDFACQCLWKNGDLVLIKTTERLSYFWGGSTVSGASSIGAVAKTVFEPRVVDVSTAAIRALDERVSGAFSVDLKEDASGVPYITEINVGRFVTGTPLFDLTGKHNMALTYVRLAMDELLDISEPYDVVEDYYMVRDLDSLPGIYHADELFEGIVDAACLPAVLTERQERRERDGSSDPARAHSRGAC
ncbi:MAG: hypothetical protein ACE5MI_14415 [Acidimicrobiia bacterium]